MIKLIAQPRVVKTWNQFCKESPAYSIALDGYVSGPTKYDIKNARLNLNHHEGVDRLSTLSTCAQAYLRIKLGLFNKFKKNNEPEANIYVNDADQDTCLAFYLLSNHEKINKLKSRFLIAKLVDIIDKFDITGGMYPFNLNADIMKEVAWVFQPYTDARLSGILEEMNSEGMKALIYIICERIYKYSIGKSKKINLDARYKVIYSGKNWKMINEIGAHARTKIFLDGIKAFISVRKTKNDNYIYTLAKVSEFVKFPIEEFYNKLNKIEGASRSNNKWGGSNTIGGSPREIGSKIKPRELIRIINSLMK